MKPQVQTAITNMGVRNNCIAEIQNAPEDGNLNPRGQKILFFFQY